MPSRPGSGLGSIRRRLSSRKKDKELGEDSFSSLTSSPPRSPKDGGSGHSRRAVSQDRSNSRSPGKSPGRSSAPGAPGNRRAHSLAPGPNVDDDTDDLVLTNSPGRNGRSGRSRETRTGFVQRLRDRSRSRSRSRTRDGTAPTTKEMMVAVTSCRSDGYYNQRAPGSTAKLSRKAPTNLKLFHELAVGVKDAYAAVGAMPKKPTDEEERSLSSEELLARNVLWEFVGNLDFVS